MAYLIKRKGSGFWWIRYLDYTKPGKPVRQSKSTGLRIDSEEETAQARIACSKLALKEAQKSQGAGPADHWGWVEDFLINHCRSPRTLKVYQARWKHVRHFMAFKNIWAPSDVRFTHGAEYVAWRQLPKRNRKQAGKNTALLEIKTWSLIMQHASQRSGGQLANPLVKLGIAKTEPPKKAEFTDEEIEKCLAALESEPEWMRLSFTIALHTGCRLRETALVMSLVDFKRMTITFDTPKGGQAKAFTRPLPKVLLPVLIPLRNRRVTHDFPFQPSRQFQHFFRRLELQHLTFHGLRVTYITRLARAGVPLPAAKRLVNHSSTAVHAIYQRLGVEDVREYADVQLFSTRNQIPGAGSDSPHKEGPELSKP